MKTDTMLLARCRDLIEARLVVDKLVLELEAARRYMKSLDKEVEITTGDSVVVEHLGATYLLSNDGQSEWLNISRSVRVLTEEGATNE